MKLRSVPVLDVFADLDAAWLSEALGSDVDAFEATPVGSGQIGACWSLTLQGGEVPDRVLLKMPTADVGTRTMLSGAYRSEVRFYTELVDTVEIRVPACHAASEVTDDGRFTLLLEDLAPARQGDQIAGCTPMQARVAAENLAGLHGPRWNDPALLATEGLTRSGPEDAKLLAEVYGPATEAFVEILDGRLSARAEEVLGRCVEMTEAWSLARQDARFSLVHGDYRLDNLMFTDDARPATWALDWQTLSLGLPARDLAFLLGTGLEPQTRAEHERSLVTSYHRALTGWGVTDHSLEECWDDYRFAMLQGPLVAVFGCAYGARSDRGDAMFAAMVERSCAAIEELGTFDLINR